MKMCQEYEEVNEMEKQSVEAELSQLMEMTLRLEDEINSLAASPE